MSKKRSSSRVSGDKSKRGKRPPKNDDLMNFSSDEEAEVNYDMDDRPKAANGAKDDFFLESVASDNEEDELSKETPEERRIRLAKEFLGQIQSLEEEDKDGGDAATSEALRIELEKARGRYEQNVADDLSNPEIVRSLSGPRFAITAIAVSGSENVFGGSKDGTVVGWNIETGKKVIQLPRCGKSGQIQSIATFESWRLVTGAEDGRIRFYDIRQGSDQEIGSFGRQKHSGPVTGLVFRQDEQLELLSVSFDRMVKIWNVDSMSYVDTLFGHQDRITSLDTVHGDTALSSSVDGSIRIWKIKEETQIAFQPKTGFGMPVDTCSMLTPNVFLSGGQDGNLSLWSKNKRRPIYVSEAAHSGEWISSVATRKYTDLAVSGSSDSKLRFWKVGTKDLSEICHLDLPGFVNSMQFSSDGKLLFAGMGNEHRFGRWSTVPKAKNSIRIIKLV